ncbi:MAG TPA: deoxyribose-phosphate aldolase [Bacilli bacterium]|nr:MAG: Deoxyribose-phosphate aldolase [Tenericutes bacterium ADurb.BinA124]HNZ50887.1 deoxyribose-phosphate aldolase [Bacilli bacterium]HPN61316.1 deoxyribose-phosphate aldolase [Bacilli bacterium]HPX84770.1 deoxyribose-phosphate aldolase [Bacilli bacterium]HQC74764.1 deoxyribose-phosphate aldolase [Bacilli bacterium]
MNNRLIDHTLLKAFATSNDIKTLCAEAKEFHFKSVCVNPTYVSLVHSLLAGTDVEICTVIGFPLGASTTATKVYETKDAIKAGATEIDMVINIGKAKDHDFAYIEEEIKAVVKAAQGKLVKVIIETCYLTDEEKIAVCEAATRAKANFVKTSTGFGSGGAVASDVALMKAHIGKNMGVKASGGIRSKADLEQMLKAGATRIGASSGKDLV